MKCEININRIGETVGDHPEEVYNHGSTVVGEDLYIFGGTNGTYCYNSIYKLLKGKTWVKISCFWKPSYRSSMNFLTCDNLIYIFGGVNDKKGEKAEKAEKGEKVEVFTDLHVFDT